jgi:hypothetical protein
LECSQEGDSEAVVVASRLVVLTEVELSTKDLHAEQSKNEEENDEQHGDIGERTS